MSKVSNFKKFVSLMISICMVVSIVFVPGFTKSVFAQSQEFDSTSGTSTQIPLYGDIDGDGSRDSLDLQILKRFLLRKIKELPYSSGSEAVDVNKDGFIDSTDGMLIADVDGDGSVDSLDLQIFKRFLLRKIVKLLVEDSIDTEPPTAPTGLVASNATDTSVTLNWDPSADNKGVDRYAIIADGISVLATSVEPSITINDLEPNRSYELWVVALDKKNNCSEKSNICTVNTTVSNIEQLKNGLIKHFKAKGNTYSLTFTGEISNIQEDINSALMDAIYESAEPFMLKNVSYSCSGSYGNLKITYNFTYDNNNEYSDVVRSIDRLKNVLMTNLNKLNENINVVYKGSISSEDIENTIESVLRDNSYLRLCIDKSSYSMSSNMGVTSILFNFKYNTSVEKEMFVDENVKLIVDGLVDEDMSEHEIAKFIHDYVLSRVIYSDEQEYNTAYDALYYGKTICAGYAGLTYKLLEAAGIENIIVTNEDHAWNLVKIDDKWYHMDTTWDDGKAKNDGYYKYYNMTDTELLETRNYSNTTGITATSNYIDDLTILNNNSDGKYKNILDDLQNDEKYVEINNFKSNSTLELEYTDIVLKEGEEISLISDKYPQGFFDEAYAWRSSNENIVEVDKGIVKAKSAGKVTIAAIQTYNLLMDNNLFAVVTVVPNESEGKTPQKLSERNFVGFTDSNVIPSIIINTGDDVNSTTTVTNATDFLEWKVDFIGEPIDINTTAKYEAMNEERSKKPVKITYANGFVEYPEFESERDILDIWLLMLDIQVLARLFGFEDSTYLIESEGNKVNCFVGSPVVEELIDKSTLSSVSINFYKECGMV